jgi:hypothetical protein
MVFVLAKISRLRTIPTNLTNANKQACHLGEQHECCRPSTSSSKKSKENDLSHITIVLYNAAICYCFITKKLFYIEELTNLWVRRIPKKYQYRLFHMRFLYLLPFVSDLILSCRHIFSEIRRPVTVRTYGKCGVLLGIIGRAERARSRKLLRHDYPDLGRRLRWRWNECN